VLSYEVQSTPCDPTHSARNSYISEQPPYTSTVYWTIKKAHPEVLLFLFNTSTFAPLVTALHCASVIYEGSHECAAIAHIWTGTMESESQKSKDLRIERLWRILDTRKEGELDLNALKKGLKKLDHRKHKPNCSGYHRHSIALIGFASFSSPEERRPSAEGCLESRRFQWRW
jgi:hypothetical protein